MPREMKPLACITFRRNKCWHGCARGSEGREAPATKLSALPRRICRVGVLAHHWPRKIQASVGEYARPTFEVFRNPRHFSHHAPNGGAFRNFLPPCGVKRFGVTFFILSIDSRSIDIPEPIRFLRHSHVASVVDHELVRLHASHSGDLTRTKVYGSRQPPMSSCCQSTT